MINSSEINAREINGVDQALDPLDPLEFDIRIIGEVVTAEIQIGEGFEPIRYDNA